MTRFLLRCALLLALATLSFADKITLKDGRVYDGTIVEETETQVKIRTTRATLTIARDQITSIEKQLGEFGEMEKRFTALDPAKPQGYLEAARWLTGPGRKLLDLKTLSRLCNASASLAPETAAEANILLGKEYTNASMHLEASRAFTRAHTADPENSEAASLAESVASGMREQVKRELGPVLQGLDIVLQGDNLKALKLLSKFGGTLLDVSAQSSGVGETYAAFLKDIACRVKCTDCGGGGSQDCVPCVGKGWITCAACEGTGFKAGIKRTPGDAPARNTACKTCFGSLSKLCEKCGAERDLVVNLTDKDTLQRNNLTVRVHAGTERKDLEAVINFTDMTARGVEVIKFVSAMSAMGISKGGKVLCATCGGVAYNPPTTGLSMTYIRKFRVEVNRLIDDANAAELLQIGDSKYDSEALQPGLRYREGKWVK